MRATIDQLDLDPKNPRLPEGHGATTQSALLQLMALDYSLGELARSLVDNGYFEEEPLVAVPAKKSPDRYVVVEGNRRLAALQLLSRPDVIRALRLGADWDELSAEWASHGAPDLPVLVYPDRRYVTPFLGFRHISGVKPWEPPEKARFINDLVEAGADRFANIAREVGSTVQSVRDSYVAYRVLTQARELELDTNRLEDSFGVFLRAMSSSGVKTFLGIETRGREPAELRAPVPHDHLDRLSELLVWLFGTEDARKVIQDSRDITSLGRVLTSPSALETLRATDDFTLALDALKGEEETVLESLRRASFQLDEAKRGIDRQAGNQQVRDLVARCRLSIDTISKILTPS